MASMPPDAKHWDSSDWIEFHRRAQNINAEIPTASDVDPSARLRSAYRALVQTAKLYHQVSGRQLPVFPAIAELHGAVVYDIPLAGDNTQQRSDAPRALIRAIAPGSNIDFVAIDLSKTFDCLLVVRIADNFEVESRMIRRADLPKSSSEPFVIRWADMPIAE